mgnify:CR=1 FL=1
MQASSSGACAELQMMTSFQENTHLSIWQMCQSLKLIRGSALTLS